MGNSQRIPLTGRPKCQQQVKELTNFNQPPIRVWNVDMHKDPCGGARADFNGSVANFGHTSIGNDSIDGYWVPPNRTAQFFIGDNYRGGHSEVSEPGLYILNRKMINEATSMKVNTDQLPWRTIVERCHRANDSNFSAENCQDLYQNSQAPERLGFGQDTVPSGTDCNSQLIRHKGAKGTTPLGVTQDGTLKECVAECTSIANCNGFTRDYQAKPDDSVSCTFYSGKAIPENDNLGNDYYQIQGECVGPLSPAFEKCWSLSDQSCGLQYPRPLGPAQESLFTGDRSLYPNTCLDRNYTQTTLNGKVVQTNKQSPPQVNCCNRSFSGGWQTAWPETAKELCCSGKLNYKYDCSPEWCPWSSGCGDSQAVINFCSGGDMVVDSKGKKTIKSRLLTNPNCKNWCLDHQQKTKDGGTALCDRAKLSFCSAHPEADECACVNPSKNPAIVDFVRNLSPIASNIRTANSVCWWPLCQGDDLSSVLLTSQKIEERKECKPGNVCQQIIDLSGSSAKEIQIDKNHFEIACPGQEIPKPHVIPPKPTPSPSPKPAPQPSPKPSPTPAPSPPPSSKPQPPPSSQPEGKKSLIELIEHTVPFLKNSEQVYLFLGVIVVILIILIRRFS